jgi:putative ABC transport system permease protein
MTVLAVAITLVAFVLLRTLSRSWTERVEQTPNDRVVSRHKIGWVPRLPARYASEIRTVPGVVTAMGGRWVDIKQPGNEREWFDGMAVEARPFVDMHYEIVAPAAEKEAFVAARQGALISRELAKKHGWAVGSALHFRCDRCKANVELHVTGIYESSRHGFARGTIWYHLEYLNELLPDDQKDTISIVSAKIREPREGAAIARAIDVRFDPSDDQTRTFEDKALQSIAVGAFSAILEAFDTVSVLVLGVLLLILGNTVAMGVRERTQEHGVLRAIGFRPGHVVTLVCGEAAVFGALGAMLGLVLSVPLVELFLSAMLEEQMGFPPLHVFGDVALLALAAGVVLGPLAALGPARQAARLEVVTALRHVD